MFGVRCSVFGVRCSVFGVRCALLPARSHSLTPVAARSAMQLAATAGTARVTLVDTSVYLKPAKLLNVAFDVLAGLAPCLNLGIGELRHKDLLDTIGADNRRK